MCGESREKIRRKKKKIKDAICGGGGRMAPVLDIRANIVLADIKEGTVSFPETSVSLFAPAGDWVTVIRRLYRLTR